MTERGNVMVSAEPLPEGMLVRIEVTPREFAHPDDVEMAVRRGLEKMHAALLELVILRRGDAAMDELDRALHGARADPLGPEAGIPSGLPGARRFTTGGKA
jgi:hypothetical protein